VFDWSQAEVDLRGAARDPAKSAQQRGTHAGPGEQNRGIHQNLWEEIWVRKLST